jgi:hypothetical protein
MAAGRNACSVALKICYLLVARKKTCSTACCSLPTAFSLFLPRRIRNFRVGSGPGPAEAGGRFFGVSVFPLYL